MNPLTMQYNQLYANGINSYGQYHGYNPQIIGEGDVTSIVSPNGTIQYFFTPVTQWGPNAFNALANQNFNQANPNFNHPYVNANTGTWFVRSIPNILQPTVFNQPCQRSSSVQLLGPCYNYDCNADMPSPGFQLKFHNDDWTSTTDLHYFYPRRCDPFPAAQFNERGSAAIQVEMPVLRRSVYHCQVVCDKPCNCASEGDESRHNTQKVRFVCDESASNMSIEESNSKLEAKCVQNAAKKPKKPDKSCNGETKSKNNRTCECKKEPPESSSDKSVMTYTDQATGCTVEVGRDTQTNNTETNSCGNCTQIQKVQSVRGCDAQPEVWLPKMKVAKKVVKSKQSEKYICESGCCSGSCSCNSESD